MRNFRELKVWQKAHQLTFEVYKTVRSFPRNETYGLVSQLQRCSSSVPSNIAEGSGRGSDADFKRYLDMAFGSANELDYQLLLAHDLEYIPTEKYNLLYAQVVEVKQMLHRFIQKLTADG